MSNWYVCTDTGTVLSAAEYQTVSHNTAHYIILGDYPNKASALAAVPRALDRHFAAKEVQDYLSAGKQQGVPLSALPELLSSYRHLSDTAQRMLLDSAYITKYASVESSQTLGSWMDEERQSADICLIDNSGSRHYLDAVLYLHSEDRADPAFQYTPLETWLRTLPLSRVECLDDHALAVVYSGFSTDQMTFLLGEAQNNLDSLNWCNQYDRASYANAGSAARLAYLQAQTPFESPFDGDCMDVSDPAERKHLCEFLKMLSKPILLFLKLE